MNNWCIFLFFHAYINEMQVQEAKSPEKSRQAALRGGI
jgi:hypothetical protein